MIESHSMQLWTHHPEEFRIDDPNLVVDASQGNYWKFSSEDFRYRQVLPLFQEQIGTDQFLWCCTERHKYPQDSSGTLLEWELNIPHNSKIRFFEIQSWEDIVHSKSDNWSGLFVEEIPSDLEGLSAVVLLPLEKEWIKCHGPIDNSKLSLTPPIRNG